LCITTIGLYAISNLYYGARIRFRMGLSPGPRCMGKLSTLPRLPSQLGGYTSLSINPPHSPLTHLRRSPCVPPEIQPDLRLCYGCTKYRLPIKQPKSHFFRTNRFIIQGRTQIFRRRFRCLFLRNKINK